VSYPYFCPLRFIRETISADTALLIAAIACSLFFCMLLILCALMANNMMIMTMMVMNLGSNRCRAIMPLTRIRLQIQRFVSIAIHFSERLVLLLTCGAVIIITIMYLILSKYWL